MDQADLDEDDVGDVCDDDIDGDGLRNVCEVPVTDSCPSACADACGALSPCDGCAATDPRDGDSDDGGVGDGEEVMRGGDPLSADDDPLPGVLSGGGVYTCAAGQGRSPMASLFVLACLGLALVRRMGRRS
jgi:hypothetical protein